MSVQLLDSRTELTRIRQVGSNISISRHLDMLAQRAQLDKRPGSARDATPVPRVCFWPILPVRERPFSQTKHAPVLVDRG
jgi:hypothetical protein